MDQEKIGRFIAERRKAKNLTQLELAEKLFISDRAVSKWERGKSLPDSSIMLNLCKELDISVNELLSGEILKMEKYDEQAEKNLIALKREKEEADKRMLRLEIALEVIGLTFGVSVLITGGLGLGIIPMPLWAAIPLMVLGFVIIVVTGMIGFRIEQIAGYYECPHCHTRYVPTYARAMFSMHAGRDKYMKCPHCGKKDWQKKVISKD